MNNGLIQKESRIIFHLSGVTLAGKSGFPAVCSCDIVKPDCFSHCMDYLEYKNSESQTTSSSDDEDSVTSISEEERFEHCTESTNILTSHFLSSSMVETFKESLSIVDCAVNEMPSICESDSKPKQCRCKEELNRFLNSKCPCEECNQTIRQSYATHVMGGVTTTPSGNQVLFCWLHSGPYNTFIV